MNKFTPTIKDGVKIKLKRTAKKIVQTVHMNPKDKGKKLYYNYLSIPIKENFIFYEAFSGLGILDNPRAIFNYLLDNPDTHHYTHVWSVENIEAASDNLKEYSEYKNVIIVERESTDYYKYLATCQYLITNSTFGYYFEKRKEQVYINTWHGVPTKYMGYEHIIERVENARGPARNFLMADYILSANRFMTDIMYKRAYMLDGLFQGKILELGYPRIDTVLTASKAVTYKRLEALGIDTNKKIILYAPTWKGTLYNNLDYSVEELKETVHKMSAGINKNQYKIYLRVHYFLYKILADDPDFKDILIPFTIDTNELLSIVDILISDYSSIFFDFLVTGRPILFYVPDLKDYKKNRGLYVPIKKLPGYVTADIEMIAASLTAICQNAEQYLEFYSERYIEMQDWCLEKEDGHSCEHIINTIFKNQDMPIAFNTLKNYKTQTLVCVNTNANGRTVIEELKEYLDNVNYFSTDITVLVTAFKEESYKEFFNHLPKQIRILVWYELPFVTKRTEDFYQREVRRTLGESEFDEVKFIGKITEYWAEFGNAVMGE